MGLLEIRVDKEKSATNILQDWIALSVTGHEVNEPQLIVSYLKSG